MSTGERITAGLSLAAVLIALLALAITPDGKHFLSEHLGFFNSVSRIDTNLAVYDTYSNPNLEIPPLDLSEFESGGDQVEWIQNAKLVEGDTISLQADPAKMPHRGYGQGQLLRLIALQLDVLFETKTTGQFAINIDWIFPPNSKVDHKSRSYTVNVKEQIRCELSTPVEELSASAPPGKYELVIALTGLQIDHNEHAKLRKTFNLLPPTRDETSTEWVPLTNDRTGK